MSQVQIDQAMIAALRREAERIEEDATYSSKSHFNAEATWIRRHYCLGIPSTILAAVVGATLIRSQPEWASACAFHSQSENGIRQELFAILIMAVIARLLAVLMTDADQPAQTQPQFKHDMITLAEDAFVLTPQHPERTLVIFSEILKEIARVRYYRPTTPRTSQPRVSRKPINKWQTHKTKRMVTA